MEHRVTLLAEETASLWMIPNFGPDLYDDLRGIKLVEHPEIVVRGRVCHQRRDVGFYSDSSQGYRYSGQVASAFPLDEAPFLREIIEEVNTTLGTHFNGVLINRYKDGNDYISAHSDSKIGLDKNNMTVASLCYGPGHRKFRIRRKTSSASTNPIVLDHVHLPRQLLVMDGDFQNLYTHEIPVEKKVTGERISLTFRHHST
jgi:alkylated DNA repair dioxygenase AlkB